MTERVDPLRIGPRTSPRDPIPPLLDVDNPSGEWLRTLLENAVVGVIHTSVERRVAYANPAAARMFGYSSPEEMVTRVEDTARDLYDDAADREELMRRLRSTGSCPDYRCLMKRKDGSTFPAILDFRADLGRDGTLGHIDGFIQDISSETEAVRTLTENERKLSAYLRQTWLGVVEWDDAFLVTEWNRAAESIFGYSRDEALGMHFSKFVPEAVRSHLDTTSRALLAGTGGEHSENENLTKDGRTVVCEWFNTTLLDASGKTTGVMSLVRDVTDRVRAENALRDSQRTLSEAERIASENEERYRTLFDQSPGGVFVLDATGRIVDVNEAFAQMHGYSIDEMLHMSLSDIDTPETGALAPERMRRILDGETLRFDAQHYHKDGHVFPLMVYVSRITIGGKPFVLGVHMDIAERKAAEEETRALNAALEERVRERTAQLAETNRELSDLNTRLLNANEDLVATNLRLDEATRAKSDFLAAMSHDLRTPLNSILGFSGIMLQDLAGSLTEEQRRQITMINNSGRHLLELVKHILDLSRIEAGKVQLERSVFEAAAVVRSVASMILPLAEQKGLELRTSASPECTTLHSDATRVEQILFNLMGNAVNFTDSGYVSLSLRSDDDHCLFEVSDTGCGIAPAELNRVFEDFYQVRRPSVAKEMGTGLGLPVSRRLAHALGGDITVSSEPGVGSTFTLRLPKSTSVPSVGA